MENLKAFEVPELGLTGYQGGRISDKLVIEKAYAIFQNKWHTSKDYTTSRPILFKGVDKDIKSILPRQAIKYIAYCGILLEGVLKGKSRLNEVNEYDDKGGLCIYLSTLLYWLLWSINIDANYCQGIYRHKVDLEEGIPEEFKSIFGEEQSGLHVWIEHKGLIIDLAIAQQRNFFKFPTELGYILGEVPQDFKLKGFREDKSIVKQYAREIAKSQGKTFYEWLDWHKNKCAELMKK